MSIKLYGEFAKHLMSKNSKIEWTDHTFNPWEGCQKVGPGCDHCYAETRNARFAGGTAINWGPSAPRRRTSAANWQQPLRWDKNHEAFFAQHGRRQRVFCASLADVFDNAVDPQWRADLWALIRATSHLDWLILTKRIGNAASMIYDAEEPLPNVWIGATVVNQEEADRDIPKLLAVPAAKRFLSIEPLLGPVNLNGHTRLVAPGLSEGKDWLTGMTSQDSSIFGGSDSPWQNRELYDFPQDHCSPHIDWVIVGGESGPGARPMHPAWVRSLRDQCRAAGVPFFFKQWGEWNPGNVNAAHAGLTVWAWHRGTEKVRIKPCGSVHLLTHLFDPASGDWCMHKVGKKVAGRLLDGREWNEVPV